MTMMITSKNKTSHDRRTQLAHELLARSSKACRTHLTSFSHANHRRTHLAQELLAGAKGAGNGDGSAPILGAQSAQLVKDMPHKELHARVDKGDGGAAGDQAVSHHAPTRVSLLNEGLLCVCVGSLSSGLSPVFVIIIIFSSTNSIIVITSLSAAVAA